MKREQVAEELLKMAKSLTRDKTAARDWVSLIQKELKELQRLGIDIPRKKMDKREIIRWFSDMDMENVGSRERSHMIDNYLAMRTSSVRTANKDKLMKRVNMLMRDAQKAYKKDSYFTMEKRLEEIASLIEKNKAVFESMGLDRFSRDAVQYALNDTKKAVHAINRSGSRFEELVEELKPIGMA